MIAFTSLLRRTTPKGSMAELFGVQVPAIAMHLKNIFESGELVEDAGFSILETPTANGKSHHTHFYNLGANKLKKNVLRGFTTKYKSPFYGNYKISLFFGGYLV